MIELASEAVRYVPAKAGTRARRRRLTVVSLVASDFVSITGAGLLSAWMYFGSAFVYAAFEHAERQLSFVVLSPMTAVAWVILLAMGGLYDLDRVRLGGAEVGRLARSLSMGVVLLILATFFLKTPGLSRAWVLLTWVLSILFVLLARLIISAAMVALRRRGRLLQPTLIVGSNAESADLLRVLQNSRDAGLVPVGCLTSSLAEKLNLDFCGDEVPVLGSARDLVKVVDEHGIDTVVVAASAFEHEVLSRIVAELRNRDVNVHISSGLFEVLTSRITVSEIAGVPLVTVKGLTLSRSAIVTKRLFDLAIAVAALVIGLPIWLSIAAIIKLTSPGPVFYGQERIGRDGKSFRMLKFRSMYQDADGRLAELQAVNEASGPLFKIKDDPRVTPIGKWMRKFSIDEFPQLLNVLKGEMSTVGPRPPLPRECERYSVRDWRRLEVTPGMTGLWQVSGRSTLTFDDMVRLDLFYIENWSVGLDLTIILRTVPAVAMARGAY